MRNQIEQGVIFNLGRKQNYNAKRITLQLARNICSYPREDMEIFRTRSGFKPGTVFNKLRTSKNSFYIERNVPDLMDPKTRVINFWVPIINKKGKFKGVLGI